MGERIVRSEVVTDGWESWIETEEREEVVRCVDCIWSKPKQDNCDDGYRCNMWIADVSVDGFCSNGKRRDA